MITLIPELGTTDVEGEFININDATVWTVEEPREDFAVLIACNVYSSSSPLFLTDDINPDPLNATTWVIPTDIDARYSITLHAFLLITGDGLIVNEVRYDSATQLLKRWDGTSWNIVTLQESVNDGYSASAPLDLPILFKARIHKNKLLLAYIQTKKAAIEQGVNRNKLFYERGDLDYFSSLIIGAEYNWALAAYENFYDLLETLKKMSDSSTL